MKIIIEKLLPEEQFIDIIVTALEGGSNYWYMLNVEEFRNNLPPIEEIKEIGENMSERIGKALYNNEEFSINVYDVENNEELLGIVTHQSCKEALEEMVESYPEELNALLNEEYDADDADLFFQIATMGEIVFG